jgi:myo-inositol 2-dehydrogenase/D-chiro-inositol 1-dehydrogenase
VEDGALTEVSSVSSRPGDGIDGIVISTPTFTHNSLIREAAIHGLHIFTEKPVDVTSELISELFDVCKQNNATLCCGFQRRFDNAYVAVERAIREGRIGSPLMATIFFGDHPAPPTEFMMTGGNIFMDLLPHDLDYVRWCLQDDVKSVYATGTSSTDELRDAGVHDNAIAVVTFQKGAVVTFTMSRGASYGYDQRCDFFGSRGMARVENESAHVGVVSDKDGVHASKLKHSFPQRFEQAFKAELNAFADAILDRTTPWPVTATDCIAVQVVSDAARESCESDLPVIL